LISPAIINTRKSIYLTPILKYFIKKTPRVWVDDTVDEDRLYLATQYWSWNWLKTGAELFALQRRTRRLLKKVSRNCLIIVSKKDEQVPVAAAGYISSRIKGRAEVFVLEHSPHVSVLGPEKGLVADRLVQWFSTGK
jgi:esterase/lipase